MKRKITVEIENKALNVESLADAISEIELYEVVTTGPVKDLPLYLGMGYDRVIEKRLRDGKNTG